MDDTAAATRTDDGDDTADAAAMAAAERSAAVMRAVVRHEDRDSRAAIVQAVREREAGHYGHGLGPHRDMAEMVREMRADCDAHVSLIAVAHRLLDSPLRERIALAGITVRDLKRSCYFSPRLHTDYEREAALRAVEAGESATVSGWFVAQVRSRAADEIGKLDLMDETLTYEERRAARSSLRALGHLPDPPEPASPPGDGRPGVPVAAPPPWAPSGEEATDTARVATPAELAAMIYGCDSIVIRGRTWRADDREHAGRRLNLDALIAAAPRSLADADIVPLLRPAPPAASDGDGETDDGESPEGGTPG